MIILDIETTGLDPYQQCIVTIQTMRNEGVKIWKVWEQDEGTILREFLKTLRMVSGDETILGYNNLKFDVPFIAGRLSVYGMMNSYTYRILYDKKWVDLYQILGDDYRSMKSWEEKLGIKRASKIGGRDVPSLFAKGEYQTIEEYAVEELRICNAVFLRATELHSLSKILQKDG